MNTTKVGLWLLAGVTGAVVFWLMQVVRGGPTITEFMGAQIVATGSYSESLATVLGWAVHLGVSLSYALLFGMIAWLLRAMNFAAAMALTLVIALVLGWATAVLAPPAISVTISLLGGQRWPAELFPLNTEINLPFWNHLLFFTLNWVVQALGPRVVRARSTRRSRQ